MDFDTTYLKRVLLVMIASLLASCSGIDVTSTRDGIPISSGELVNLKGGGSVRAPEGIDWRVLTNGVITNEVREEIKFERRQEAGKSTFISIARGYTESSPISQTEDQAAALFFNNEERIMRERGSTRSYYLKDLSRENTTIGKKKLHVMKYTISDLSRVPMEIKYAMYLYFPDYNKQPKKYNIFLIGDVLKIKNTEYATDLTVINKVIESYEHD